MKKTDRVSQKFISEKHKATKKWKTLAGIMAIIVTFTTTYSLIMPAITVSREQVDEIAGLYLDDFEEAFDIVEDNEDGEELYLPEAAVAQQADGIDDSWDDVLIEEETEVDTEANVDVLEPVQDENAHSADGIITDSVAAETATEKEIETETEVGTETEVETDTEKESETVGEETETDAETEADTEAETETDAETETETEAETETETETASGTETELQTETETETRFPAQRFTASEDGVLIIVNAPESAFPEGTTMIVSHVDDEQTLKGIEEAAQTDEKLISRIEAVDICFRDADGNEIEPKAPVSVCMITENKASKEDPVVVHVNDDGHAETVQDAEVYTTGTHDQIVLTANGSAANQAESETETIDESSTDAAAKTAIEFETEQFSIYAVVYTVDFEYSVNGKTYQFSLPGGGYVSFTDLVEVLGIIGDTNSDKNNDENVNEIADNAEENTDNEGTEEYTVNSDPNTPLVLRDVEVSEATRKFVADVASVEFSTPALVDVSKVESETTVGQIKEKRGLECEYSSELTEEQITEINAQTVEAGDWALISVQPFTSEETLTVTMKDGEVFAIRVTDAQIKKMVIDAKGDTWEITVTYGEDAQIPDGAELRVKEITQEEEAYNDLQDDIMENLADKGEDIPAHPVLFDIAIVCGDQEIEPAEGSEVNVQIRLINNAIKGMFTDEDSPLLVNDDPVTQKMSDIEQNVEVIHQVETGNLDVVNTQDTITEEAVVSEFTTGSFSDWLLFLDETVKNITIGRGDTITLRPYSKWVWKRVAEEEQYKAYEWKVPANNNVISFSKADKTDDQLNETYTYYHGQANNTGSFDLQLTDNGTVVHTIHVTVVEDVPDLPPTIPGTDEIAVNLFDYDINTSDRTKSGTLDQQANVASSSAFRNTSVNRYSDLQFLGYGGSNTDSEWFSINNYTKDVPNQGILDPRLDNGYPKLGLSTEGKTRSKPSLAYLFDTSSRNNDVYAYPNLTGLFQKDTEGYYYYNSNNNYAYYNVNGNSNQITLYKHTYSQWTSGSAGPNAKPIGFFPFHQYDSYLKEGNTGMNFNTNLNHHFGMSMAVDFEIPSDGLDDYGNPITFEFSGDDDMWVFIDDNLVLDVGGIHQPVTGSINFSSDHVSVYGKPDTTITQRFTDANSPTAWEIGDGKPHTMKIFYLERGGCDSNLSVRFNIPRRFGKGKLALVKHEEGKTTPLQGATFKIWDNAECKGEPIAEVTSDGNGNVNFGEFILNSATTTFYMKETDGPDGYIREPRVYQIRPRMNQGAVVKNGDYIVLDVFGPDGNALTKVQNDAVEFPNAKIGTIDIPVKKNWTASSESSAIVELTIKRYKLIDKTKGFMIIKELTGEPEDYQFTAQYTITYPDGHSETVQFDVFDGGVYSLPDAEPGNYVIEETVTSQAPDGYTMTHSTQRVEVTLDEDGMAQANFNTTFQKQKGDLYIKANVDIRNGNASDIDYTAVRYAVLDESGKKVTSITHAEAVYGKTLNLPVGNYTVKAVSVPKTPTTYSLTQQKFNDRNGVISSPLTVRANQQTDAVYSAVYVKKNNAQNCTWKIRDQYKSNNGREIVYKSGNVEYPVGTKLRMSFQVPMNTQNDGTQYHGVWFNGQELTGNTSNLPNGKLEYNVEFTVADNAQLDYSINVYRSKQIDISGPYFEVVGTANNSAVSPNQASRNIKNALRAPSNNAQVDANNTAAHPDAPEGKKYVKDTVWSQKVTLNSGNNWQDSTTLKNLPECDEEGNPYYYYVASVHETGVSEGTSCSIDLDNGKQLLIGDDLNSGSNLSVTNKQIGSLKITKDVTVNASLVTDHTKASPADGTYTFEITKKGDASFAKRTVELTVTNGVAVTEEIDELEPGIYTVTELKPENGSEISSINGTPTQLYSAEIEVRAGMTGTTAASLTFVNNIVDTRLKVIKVKKGTTEPVSGAVFSLTKVDNEGRQITTQGDSYYKEETVDAITGELEFTGLTKGRYKLEETHVPDGYVKKEAAYFISIGNDGAGALDLTVPHTMINPKSGSDFTVENEPGVALPSTGGPGTNILYLLGSLMLAFGSAGFVMRKRRRVG